MSRTDRSTELPQHDAEERLRRSEAKFAGIVELAPDAIISIDAAERITLFNDGAISIFGWSREEILGKPLSLLLPERFRARHSVHIAEFARSGLSGRRMGERTEIYGLRKSGEEFPAEASISHLELDGESVFTVVLRDISERKRTERILAESRDQLEQRVSERTRALREEMRRREETQALLIQAQRMEAFGQLTGGIAHDFNNLLTIVAGNLELLELRLKDERDLDLLRRAKAAADMGGQLTQRLLTFARRRKLAARPLNLNEVVVGLAELLRRTLGEPIIVETRFASELWIVNADPSEIENAILNLAINARDAMPHGGRLTLATMNVSSPGEILAGGMQLQPGDYVCLSVADTGTGMTPEVAARAFEPFFTTKEPGKGTGLGLSTVYGLLRQQGGAVALTSAVGAGTTVTLYFPRAAQAVAAPPHEFSAPTLPEARGERILLVEDNPDVREVARQHLEGLGYVVIEAETGAAAIARLADGIDVDIVMSDIVMAGGASGYDVARWVRQNRPGLGLLLTTGHADETLGSESSDLGDIPVLDKPFTRADLAHAIRACLER